MNRYILILSIILSGCGEQAALNSVGDSAQDPGVGNLAQTEIEIGSITFDGTPKSTFLASKSLYQVNSNNEVTNPEVKDKNGKPVIPKITFQYKLDETHTVMRYETNDNGDTKDAVVKTTGEVVDCSDYDLTYAQLEDNILYTYSKDKKKLKKINLDTMNNEDVATVTPASNFFVTYDKAHMDIHQDTYNSYSFLMDVNQNIITRIPNALQDIFGNGSTFTHHTEVGDLCQNNSCRREIISLPNKILNSFTWFQDVDASHTEIASLQLAMLTPQGTNADKGIYNEGTTVSQMPIGTLHPIPTQSTYRLTDTERFMIFREGFYYIYKNTSNAIQVEFFWMNFSGVDISYNPILQGGYLYWRDSTHVYRKSLAMLHNTVQQGGYYTETSATETVATNNHLSGFSVVNGAVIISSSEGTTKKNNPDDDEKKISDDDLQIDHVVNFRDH